MTDGLADIRAIIARMSDGEKAELDKLIAPELSALWLPNPGPQTQAYHCDADLLLYGGAAGGGKTDLLLGLSQTQHQRSVIFRRAYVDLRGIEDRMVEIIGSRDGYNAADKVLRRDGRVLEFGALEKPGAEFSWQGRPHDFIGFDEGAQLAEAKVRFVIGWLRTTEPGQRCRAVIASNPPIGSEGSWLVRWFAPWLDPMFPNPAAPGELRWCVTLDDGEVHWVDGPGAHEIEGRILTALSRTFIPARLDDNPYLKGTNYQAQIESLPEPLRSQLRDGDFMAGRQDAERQVIPTEWIRAAQERWREGKPAGSRMLTLGVDVALGGQDMTILAPLYGVWFDEPGRMTGKASNSHSIASAIVERMRDRCQIHIDATGGWASGVRAVLDDKGIATRAVVSSHQSGSRTKDQLLGFYNVRAEMWWKFREALDPDGGDKIALPPDVKLEAQLAAPTWSLRGDKIIVESKDEVRKRLGSSTDEADAYLLAWHRREEAAFLQKHGGGLPGTATVDGADDDPLGEWR